ncbi:MAG TPA: hypothetical protein DCP11_02080 [Microbacteriaceae bacterium]|jgi:hypothetical protein|nr:hypothetical protein [Microbacteriaceae bacterium]
MSLFTALVRPIALVWLASVARASLDLSRPSGVPQVHADGADADRILLVADGPSVGHGQLSHELGLAGHLARQLSWLTGRGADIDIIAEGNMTAAGCLAVLAAVDLSRFDALVLTIGANEALSLSSVGAWRGHLSDLLDHIENSAYGLHTFVIGVPSSTSRIHFPRPLARIVDRQVVLLNRVTAEVCDGRPAVSLLPFDPPLSISGDRNSSKSFDSWASLIAPSMRERLDFASGQPRVIQASDEAARQQALDDLSVLDTDPEARIDLVMTLARNLFGTSGAAVTFIDHERAWVKSALGMDVLDEPRIGAFCDMTIRNAEIFVVEDTALDPRFRHHPSVTGHGRVRFYAGYPLEAPDGRRVGALCVVDTMPRSFSKGEAALLRTLTLRVQEQLWLPRSGDRP